MKFRIFQHYGTDLFIYCKTALRNFISKLFKRNKSQKVPYSLFQTSSPESSEASVLKENLEETSDSQVRSVESTSRRTKRNRPKRRLKENIFSMSEVNRFRTLEETFEEEFETELTTSSLNSELKSSRITRFKSVSIPDSSIVANAEGATDAGTTAKFRTLGNKKVRKKRRKRVACAACKKGQISEIFQEEGYEEKVTFLQLIRWIENKIALLKSLSATSELTSDDRKKIIENVLEDVKKANRIASKTESMSMLFELIEKTALSLLLAIDKTANNIEGIDCLASILKHLSAIAGAKITSEEVQKCINSDLVLSIYDMMQDRRKLIQYEMETIKKNIEHGTEEVQKVRELYKEHFKTVKDVFTRDAASSDLQEMNLKLKAAAAASEEFLNQYGSSLGYLATNAKTFFNSKVETEQLVNKFLTKKIENLFKAGECY